MRIVVRQIEGYAGWVVVVAGIPARIVAPPRSRPRQRDGVSVNLIRVPPVAHQCDLAIHPNRPHMDARPLMRPLAGPCAPVPR